MARIRTAAQLEKVSLVKNLRIVFAFVLIAAFAAGQAPVGRIAGSVKDPSRAVVPGATVTATSATDGGKRTTTSNSEGFFEIPTLSPGVYKLAIRSQGFSDFVVDRVVVDVGGATRVDALLKVGSDVTLVE